MKQRDSNPELALATAFKPLKNINIGLTPPARKHLAVLLVGIPLRITVGKRSLKDGVVEFQQRAGGDVQKVAPDEAVNLVKAAAPT